ncbi:MAG: T9SS type A sorting domain-containing protein, partial [Flavobacteriales bacterium]|nr:T9SS type A sorting domain-containing protein [Flavobacteriales bacterium]
PSAIDWDSDGITKVGLASAVYVYDPSSGQYSSYVNGISVGPLDGLISSGQAFWVKAIEDNPSLIIDEAAKSDDQGVHLRSTDFNTSATIRLALESTNRSDEVVFGFNDDCSADFDKDYDAFKFYPSSTNTPSLAIYPNGFDTAPYVVSMSQFPSEMFQLPLEVKRGNQTQFTLSLVEVDADNELCMFIEDLETGSKHSLSIGESYAFEMTATSPEERFIIHLAPPLDVAVINEHCFGAEDGEIIAQGFGDAPWNFIWKDEMGQVIQENNQMTNSDHLSNLAPGLYEVIVQGSNELCSSTSSMVMVETAELPELSSSFAQTSCNYSTGEIQVEVNDDYNWNFELFDENNALVGSFSQEENGAVFSNLSAGLYELHAENECNETVSFDVFNLNDPFASSISINNIEVAYHTNENIVFTATNDNCQEITWSLGNGDVISSNENLIYEYNESGTFEVIVTGSNAYCSSSDTLTMIISDREVADITVPFVDVELDELTDENEKGENEIALNITDAEINFNFGDKTYEKLNLSIYSITGQLVHRAVITNTQTFNVSTADFPSGIYHIEMNDDVQVLLSEKCYLD